MKLVIPGKTFLVGEYAVLVGGKALGVATEPCFETDFRQKHQASVHEKSAAGLFLKSVGKSDLQIHAVVSQCGVGGFGQSTAEFIATWFHHHSAEAIEVPAILKEIFNQYRDLFEINPELRKIKPSGADLVTQLLGKITYFDPEVTHSKTLGWVFPELDFDIVTTGVKVPTHEHLATLDLISLEPLCDVADQVLANYLSVNQEAFMNSMQEWSLKLAELNLQHNHSLELKQLLENCPEVILAKPNGALGADTMTVFYKKDHKSKIYEYFKNNNVSCITGLDRLSTGAHYVD